MFQCLRNGSFLFQWALWLPGIVRLGLVVILPLNNAVFLLYLCDIEVADFQSGMLENVFPDFLVGCLTLRRSQIQLVHLHFDLDMFLALKFGQ